MPYHDPRTHRRSGLVEAVDPAFWRQRLHNALAAGRDPQAAVYDVTPETWRLIQEATRKVLAPYARSEGWILDVCCGIGSLCEVIPDGMGYIGFDICQEFVDVARRRYGGPERGRYFIQWDLRDGLGRTWTTGFFDLAVCRSVEGTVLKVLLDTEQEYILQELRRVAGKIFYIGYNDEAVQKGEPPLDCRVEEVAATPRNDNNTYG